MKKQVFFLQRTFARYDENHVVGYIHEKVLNDYVADDPSISTEDATGDSSADESKEETEKTEDGASVEAQKPKKKGVLAFRYDEVIIECKDESRDNLINGLIRLDYSETQEFAVLRHHSADPEQYADEWKAYNDCVQSAKDEVSRWLR